MGFYPKIRQGNWGSSSQRAMFRYPIFIHFDDRLDQLIKLAGLNKKRARTQLPNALHIAFNERIAEDQFGHPVEFGMLLEPLEKFETVHAGHLQIGDDDTRERVTLALGILPFAAQVGNCLITIMQFEDRILHTGFFESETHHLAVVLRILYQHYYIVHLHNKTIGYIDGVSTEDSKKQLAIEASE